MSGKVPGEKHARTRCAHQLQGLSTWLGLDLMELFDDDVLDGCLPRSRATSDSDHQWFAVLVIRYVVLEKLHTASLVPLKPDLSVAERMSGVVLWCCKLCSQRHLQLEPRPVVAAVSTRQWRRTRAEEAFHLGVSDSGTRATTKLQSGAWALRSPSQTQQ
jgi:hypothetical protein